MKNKILSALLLMLMITFFPNCKSKVDEMARIPAGSFEMGSNDGPYNEKPVHTVNISEFWIDKYEVTNGEYKKCVDAGVCRAPLENKSFTRKSYYGDSRYENYPVILVSWDDANKYCQWRGKRLPTEAEWEYAARGGLEGKKYPNGDSIGCNEANYARSNAGLSGYDKCKDSDGKENDNHPVGSYDANGYGLYDMAGNVWEWVSDYYSADYYRNSPSHNPQGPSIDSFRVDRSNSLIIQPVSPIYEPFSGITRVTRGGSWSTLYSDVVRVSNRGRRNPTDRDYDIGFRCAR